MPALPACLEKIREPRRPIPCILISSSRERFLLSLLEFVILIIGGFACGVINAVAGGGSFISLPILLWLGLPPQVANATNRVGIVLQCAAGVTTYHAHGVRPWRQLPAIALMAVPGAILGALLAARVDEDVFRWVAAILFVVMASTIFIEPGRWTRAEQSGRIRPLLYPLFFVIGVYGGFLQAGVGVLMLGSFVLFAGFDVVRGNALKFGLALTFTSFALLTFAQADQVRWLPGLVLALGTIAGGALGAKLVIKRGARWVRWFGLLAAQAAPDKLKRA
jgi:uncharacterized membrane protein YfcA